MAKRPRLWMQAVRQQMQKKGTVGAFTKWCKSQGFSGVTAACIAKGKASKNPRIVKRATLAGTFRKFGGKKG